MLRITKLTDYGTVILACLAGDPARVHTAAEVAERTHLGLPTVSKLLKRLHNGGLVLSSRGSHGGYKLAASPAEISAAAILNVLEGPLALTECSHNHGACEIAATCRVGHSWQRISGAILESLEDVSLAQLAGLERGAIRGPNLNAAFKPADASPLVRAAVEK